MSSCHAGKHFDVDFSGEFEMYFIIIDVTRRRSIAVVNFYRKTHICNLISVSIRMRNRKYFCTHAAHIFCCSLCGCSFIISRAFVFAVGSGDCVVVGAKRITESGYLYFFYVWN